MQTAPSARRPGGRGGHSRAPRALAPAQAAVPGGPPRLLGVCPSLRRSGCKEDVQGRGREAASARWPWAQAAPGLHPPTPDIFPGHPVDGLQ